MELKGFAGNSYCLYPTDSGISHNSVCEHIDVGDKIWLKQRADRPDTYFVISRKYGIDIGYVGYTDAMKIQEYYKLHRYGVITEIHFEEEHDNVYGYYVFTMEIE